MYYYFSDAFCAPMFIPLRITIGISSPVEFVVVEKTNNNNNNKGRHNKIAAFTFHWQLSCTKTPLLLMLPFLVYIIFCTNRTLASKQILIFWSLGYFKFWTKVWRKANLIEFRRLPSSGKSSPHVTVEDSYRLNKFTDHLQLSLTRSLARSLQKCMNMYGQKSFA